MTDHAGSGHSDLAKIRAGIEGGGAARYHEAAAAAGKLFARDRIALLADEGSFTEDGAFANVLADGLPADGVITGTATIDGRPVALMANDSTVKAGSWGARTVEKIIRIIEKAYGRDPDGLPGRLGRRPDHRPGGDVPRPPRRRQDLPHPGPRLRLDPAGVRAVRPVRGRRRLHPRVLRLRRHGGRQRLDVPGQPADGRDGGQRADHAGGDGRRPDALHRLRLRAPPGRDRGAGASRRSAATCPTCPATGGSGRRQAPPGEPEPADLRALVPASERQAFDMRRYVRGLVDAGSLFEIHALWAPRARRRLRPAGRPADRGGRQQPDVQGRRAVRRLGRQGAPGSSSCATRSACRCCSWPTCPASWSARRWSGRASSGTAPR